MSLSTYLTEFLNHIYDKVTQLSLPQGSHLFLIPRLGQIPNYGFSKHSLSITIVSQLYLYHLLCN